MRNALIATLAVIVTLCVAGHCGAALAKSQSAVAYVESLYDPNALGGTARYSPRLQKLWDDASALPR